MNINNRIIKTSVCYVNWKKINKKSGGSLWADNIKGYQIILFFPFLIRYFKTWKTTKFSMYSVLAAKCQISINWKKSCWNSLNWMKRSIPYQHLIQDCFFGIISGIFHTHTIFQRIKREYIVGNWEIRKNWDRFQSIGRKISCELFVLLFQNELNFLHFSQKWLIFAPENRPNGYYLTLNFPPYRLEAVSVLRDFLIFPQ